MHTPFDLFNDPDAALHPHPFAELRTFPGGWDLSDQGAINNVSRTSNATQPGVTSGEIDISSNGNGWRPEKFAEPRTIPAGWDISALK